MPRAIGLAARSKTGPLSASEREVVQAYPHPVVVVSSGFRVPSYDGRAVLGGELRDAAAILSTLGDPDRVRSLIGKSKAFVRSTGTGPRPIEDAWSQLYGRLWNLNRGESKGYRLEFQHERPGKPWPIEEMLFPQLTPVPIDVRRLGPRRNRIGAAALVDMHTGDGLRDWDGYTRTVVQLLQHQGWSMSSLSNPGEGDIHISGPHGSLDIGTRRLLRERPASYIYKAVLDRDIGAIRSILATENASPKAILTSLFTRGELPATVRDLSYFSTERGTIWGLFASQIRRFVRTIRFRTLSQYFGLLVQAAVHHDDVHTDIQDVLEVMHATEFEGKQGIVCSGLKYEAEFTIVDLLFTSREHSRRFRLRIGNDGVAILPPEHSALSS